MSEEQKEYLSRTKEEHYGHAMASIATVNDFLAHSNCSYFMIGKYDGCRLHLWGSFDLSYYYEIEVIFIEVSYISMDTSFGLWELENSPFRLERGTEDDDSLCVIKIYNDMEDKTYVICCDDVDVSIGVKNIQGDNHEE